MKRLQSRSHVHDMNGQIEAEGRFAVPSRRKFRQSFAQVTHHPPKQLLVRLRKPFPFDGEKSVVARGRSATNARHRIRMQLQGITQVIQADALGQLRVAQTHHMTLDGKRARLILRPGCPRHFEDQVLGNKMANLAEDVRFGACWAGRFIFHPSFVAGLKSRPSFFSLSLGGRL